MAAGSTRHIETVLPHGSVLYTQALAASMTLTPAIGKKGKLAKAATMTLTPAVVKKIKTTKALTMTLAVAIAKKMKKPYALGITLAVAIIKKVKKPYALSMTLTLSQVVKKKARNALALTMTLTPSVVKKIRMLKVLVVTLALAQGVKKEPRRILTTTITLALSMAKKVKIPYALGVTLTPSQVVKKKARNVLAVTMTLTPSVAKKVKMLKALSMSLAVVVVKKVKKSYALGMTLAVAELVKKKARRAFAAAMTLNGGTLGKTVLGGSQTVAGSGFITLQRITIPGSGMHFAKIDAKHRGNGTVGSAKVRPALYADNSGAPGALIEMGAEVSIDTSDTNAREIDMPFSNNPRASGAAWIGWWLGAGTDNLIFYYDTSAPGTEQYAASTYSSAGAAPNPFPSPSLTNNAYTVYAYQPMMDFYATKRRALAASMALTTALARIKRSPRPLALTLTLTAASTRLAKMRRSLAVTLTLTSALTRRKQARRAISANIVLTPAVSRASKRFRMLSVAETLAVVMIVSSKGAKTFALTLTLATTMVKRAKHKVIAAVGVALATASTHRATKRRNLDLGVTLTNDLSVGGKHHLSFPLVLSMVLAIAKKVRIAIVAPFLQTNPRMSLQPTHYHRFDISMTLATAMRRFRAVRRVFNLSTTNAVVMASFRKIFRRFSVVVVFTRGFTLHPFRSYKMNVVMTLTPSFGRITRIAMNLKLNLITVLVKRPAKFYLLGKNGLSAARAGTTKLLEATGLKRT